MVERRHRAPVTTFYLDGALAGGREVTLPESAAHHARVKRMSAGDAIEVTNGQGRIATGAIRRIGRAAIDVNVTSVRDVAPSPPLELYAPVGDRDRMLWLAEKATELGATAWRPIVFHRSRSVSPRGEGDAFPARVRARMINALEQSGGAWLPVLFPESDVATSAGDTTIDARYLLEMAGRRLHPGAASAAAAIILGPEGGVEDHEREQLIGGGWRPVAVAANILRFETAGVAAMAIIRGSQVTDSEVDHG